MKKKVLSLLLVAAMGLSMLVGCGGGNDQPSGGNTEGAGNGEVKEIKQEELPSRYLDSVIIPLYVGK